MKRKLLTIIMLLNLFGVFWATAQEPIAQVSLTSPVSQVNAGDTFTLTITVAEAVGIYGGSVQLTYDPLLLAVVPAGNEIVTPGDFFAAGPSLPLKNTVDAASGTIDYALTLRQPAEPVTGGGILGTVQFEALADGTAQVELNEAQLLAPVFEEVNGRRIASQVNEMPLQTQNVTLTVGNAAESDRPAFAEHSAPNQPLQPITTVTLQPRMAVSPMHIVGAIFFVLGMVMFLFSVMTFTRLRRFS